MEFNIDHAVAATSSPLEWEALINWWHAEGQPDSAAFQASLPTEHSEFTLGQQVHHTPTGGHLAIEPSFDDATISLDPGQMTGGPLSAKPSVDTVPPDVDRPRSRGGSDEKDTVKAIQQDYDDLKRVMESLVEGLKRWSTSVHRVIFNLVDERVIHLREEDEAALRRWADLITRE